MISSRRRPAPSVDRKPSHFTGRPTRLAASPCKNLFAVGGMTLQKTQTTRHVPLAGGGMTLQIGWRHEPANWHLTRSVPMSDDFWAICSSYAYGCEICPQRFLRALSPRDRLELA